MENNRIKPVDVANELSTSFLDYSMSVIISRALPDVRDGLKPSQRRILYAMKELNLSPGGKTRKCSKIVGDTMGNYHPHGDAAIYGTLVNMAQDWSMRDILVIGQGNFGTPDGDPPAAARYTEAKLSGMGVALMADLDKDTVDFVPTYDNEHTEPTVFPSAFPNLLVNGGTGIAVGMATNMPPHNLGEVVDGICAVIDNPHMTVDELRQYIKGPDFPTGGIVTNQDELLSIYSTGVGKIKVRGRVAIEKLKGGKECIVVTEIPYTMIGAGIGKFLNDVYGLVEKKQTNDIVDISNQSSKEGIRIVIELRKGADAENLCNLLYKKTKLEDTFGVNMLAVADGKPETMGLVPLIRHHVDFQYELATRKYKTLLAKELEKQEVQEGLIRACDVIDLIIEILRGSKNVKDAKACLISGDTSNIKFKHIESEQDAKLLRFTERQATAILEMRLYKLIGLELEALLKEHEQTMKNIAEYEKILGSRAVMAKVIIKELDGYRKAYGRQRRTTIDNVAEAIVAEPKIEETDVVVLMDRFGYAKAVDVATYERNKEAADAENRYVLTCKNTDRICLFTNRGNMHLLKVLDLPFGRFRDKGTPIDNLSNYDSSAEQLVYLSAMNDVLNKKLIFGTKTSMLKLVDGAEFEVGKRTTAATKLADGDELIFVGAAGPGATLVMESEKSVFLRISIDTVPEKKKTALGVRGMRLAPGDTLAAIHYLDGGDNEMRYGGKDAQVALNRLHICNRDTKGVKR